MFTVRDRTPHRSYRSAVVDLPTCTWVGQLLRDHRKYPDIAADEIGVDLPTCTWVGQQQAPEQPILTVDQGVWGSRGGSIREVVRLLGPQAMRRPFHPTCRI